jgi:hypothetical protein
LAAAGLAVALLLLPGLLLLVNATWLRNHSHWELLRLKPLELLYFWAGRFFGVEPDPVLDAGYGFATDTRLTFFEMLRLFIRAGEVGLNPLFALLMFGGVAAWWRVWSRRDHQPLFYAALALAGGTWIHLWCSQATSYRYFFPFVLLGAPFAALGLMSLAGVAARFAAREPNRRRALVTVGALALMAVVGWGDALSSKCAFRRGEPLLGAWIRDRYGPDCLLLGSEGTTHVIGYYAEAKCRAFPFNTSDGVIVATAMEMRPHAVLLVLSKQLRKQAEPYKELAARMKPLGYEPVARSAMPPNCSSPEMRRGR